MVTRSKSRCFNLNWHDEDVRLGIRLRVCGEGQTVILIPGMEGSGESCVDLAEWLMIESSAAGNPLRMILVDYSEEKKASVTELVTSIATVIGPYFKDEPILWSQSFGNIIASALLAKYPLRPKKHLLFSPFASLARWKLIVGSALMMITPSAIYRVLSPWVSVRVFGPMERSHPFLTVLQEGDIPVFRKRISWMSDPQLYENFQFVVCPREIWIGRLDRLIDPQSQVRFFKNSAGSFASRIRTVNRAGHMLFPHLLDRDAQDELIRWFLG